MFCFNLNILYTYIYTHTTGFVFFLCTLFCGHQPVPAPGSMAGRGTGTPRCCPDTWTRKQLCWCDPCAGGAAVCRAPVRPHTDTAAVAAVAAGCHTWVYSSAGGSDVEVTVSYSEALMLYLIYCEGRVKIYFSIRNFPSVSGGWCTVLLQVLSYLFGGHIPCFLFTS